MLGPFTREWPGLAAQEHTPLTPAERQHAPDVMLPRIRRHHGATPEARIGLVAAGRPADVLAVIGWDRLYSRGEESLLPFTAVLDAGFEDLRLLVERPPCTLGAAQRIAAEQVVLANDCLGGCRDIPKVAVIVQMRTPAWGGKFSRHGSGDSAQERSTT
jgi:hypothetical protein